MDMIYIGAGHGGNTGVGWDRGAMANGTTEWDVCTKVMQQVADAHKGTVHVIPQRLALPNRINWLQKHLAPDDLYVEMHMNAHNGTASGVEVFYLGGKKNDQLVAQAMSSRFAKKVQLPDRGAKADTSTRHKRLGVIRDVRCKSYLIEMGFIDNKADLLAVQTRGVFGMEALLEIHSTDVNNIKPKKWAQEAWDRALKAGVISEKTNPEETISSETLQWIFFKLGMYTKEPSKKTTMIQELIVGLDRKGLFTQ